MITVKNFNKNTVDGKFKNEISFEKFLEKVARIVLKGENVKIKDVSIVLIEPQEIRALNKKYRKKDKATDVLSFDYGDSGEIALCLEEIKNNSQKFGTSLKKEVVKVLIHGILHLCGYNHEESKKETKKMEEKEKSYIKLLI